MPRQLLDINSTLTPPPLSLSPSTDSTHKTYPDPTTPPFPRQPSPPSSTPPSITWVRERARSRATPSTTSPPRAAPSPPRRAYNVDDVGGKRNYSLGILNLNVKKLTNKSKTIRIQWRKSTIQINTVHIQPACPQTKRRNILNWLTMRANSCAKMRNVQTMKQQKR